MRIKTLLGLILCNLVWSANPLMGKLALRDFDPYQVAFLRYGSAAVFFFILYPLLRRRSFPPSSSQSPTPLARALALPRSTRTAVLIFVLGFAPFGLAPLLQLSGLQLTQSIDNALIIGLEPLFSIFLAWIFLREKLLITQWLAIAGALVGFTFLSGGFHFSSTVPAGLSTLGFFWMAMALWGEAAYTVVGRKLVKEYDPEPLFGSAIFIGAVFLTLVCALKSSFPAFALFSAKNIAVIFWLGPLATSGAYLYWITATRESNVTAMVLTLFIQPIMGTLMGWIFLGDRLTPSQAFGALLILMAVGLQSRTSFRPTLKKRPGI